jgi:hypothetical protein
MMNGSSFIIHCRKFIIGLHEKLEDLMKLKNSLHGLLMWSVCSGAAQGQGKSGTVASVEGFCIEKLSSAKLSAAIDSMSRWYRNTIRVYFFPMLRTRLLAYNHLFRTVDD